MEKYVKTTPGFATHTGFIHLQDHSDTIVECKNMFIRWLEVK